MKYIISILCFCVISCTNPVTETQKANEPIQTYIPSAVLDSITTVVTNQYSNQNCSFMLYVDVVFPTVTNLTYRVVFHKNKSATLENPTLNYFISNNKKVFISSGLEYIFRLSDSTQLKSDAKIDSVKFINYQIDGKKIIPLVGNLPFSPQLDIEQ